MRDGIIVAIFIDDVIELITIKKSFGGVFWCVCCVVGCLGLVMCVS